MGKDLPSAAGKLSAWEALGLPGEASRAKIRHDLCTHVNIVQGYGARLSQDPGVKENALVASAVAEVVDAGLELPHLIDEALADPEAVAARRLRHQVAAMGERTASLRDRLAEGHLATWGKISAAVDRLDALVTSALGSGPLDVAPEQTPAAVPQRLVTPPKARAARAPGELLVVDDNEDNRELISGKLVQLGHRVTCAAGGEEALALLAKRQFDVVLLDIMMPGMSGHEVLARMKQDPALRHTPVLVLSALTELQAVVSCIELGAEDYLPKPFEEVILQARIGACLEKKRLHDQELSFLRQLDEERRRADALLSVILPPEIAAELKTHQRVEPRRHENVAILFCDIVNFTSYCEREPPHQVVSHLQELIQTYEDLALRYDVQKIKTIGDAFLAVAGLLKPVENPVLACVRYGVEMIEATRRLPPHWSVRVGIHVGPVVAGVLGRRQYLFDLWGDAVNTAARIESHGITDSITLSAAAVEQLGGAAICESLGSVAVKGKGAMEIFRFQQFS